MPKLTCKEALQTVLDQVDYTRGACGVTEMVGAVLPKKVIVLAHEAIAKASSAAINPDAIAVDLAWLLQQPHSIQRDHIEAILRS